MPGLEQYRARLDRNAPANEREPGDILVVTRVAVATRHYPSGGGAEMG